MASSNSNRKRPSSSYSSAEIVSQNDDLLFQIFLYLPPKTILFLQSVNKHWLSIISSPEFRLKHSIHNFSFIPSGLFLYDPFHPNTSKSIIFDSDSCSSSSSPSIFPPKLGKSILESCNGLFLCYFGLSFNDQTTKFYICNPTTKQSTLLPTRDATENETSFTLSLAFDPSLSPYYKVIHLYWSQMSLKFHSQVYSSETCRWKPSNHVASAGNCGSGYLGKGVYCNGAVHWMHGSDHLVYYKTVEDCLNIVKLLPRHADEKEIMVMYTILSATRNKLLIVENIYDDMHRLAVFELDRDYLGFVQKYNVSVSEVLSRFPDIDHHSYRLLKAFEGGTKEEEDIVIVVSIRGNVIAHHSKDNSTQILLSGLHSKAKRRPVRLYVVYNYIQSLYPV